MTTIYVFDNTLLGDDGDDFSAALIAKKTCANDDACLDWFRATYNINDYTCSFSAPDDCHGQ